MLHAVSQETVDRLERVCAEAGARLKELSRQNAALLAERDRLREVLTEARKDLDRVTRLSDLSNVREYAEDGIEKIDALLNPKETP